MTITPRVFEAFLKCPTKCWLRAAGEQSGHNTYAEWIQAQNESYRVDAAKRMTADASADEYAGLALENLRVASAVSSKSFEV